MENVNVGEIRARLQHGDFAILAKKCNTTPRVVSEVLNKGRDAAGRYDQIVEAALDLLKGEAEGKRLIVEKAKEAGLSTSTFNRNAYKHKSKSKSYQGEKKNNVVDKVVWFGALLLGCSLLWANLSNKKQ
jgi:hypothetical protein